MDRNREEQDAFVSALTIPRDLEEDLVDDVALVLHASEAHHPSQFEEINGFKMRLFKTGEAWDTRRDELTEWERDDLRRQARAVLSFLQDKFRLHFDDVRVTCYGCGDLFRYTAVTQHQIRGHTYTFCSSDCREDMESMR